MWFAFFLWRRLPAINEFAWNIGRERAAELVAADSLTDVQIASQVGVTKRTLERWKRIPEFRARVDEIVAAFRGEAIAYSIASRMNRIADLDLFFRRLQRIVNERAEDPAMQRVPGGTTGILSHRVKSIGFGKNNQIVHEYPLDVRLLRAVRSVLREAAQQLGEWHEQPKAFDGVG